MHRAEGFTQIRVILELAPKKMSVYLLGEEVGEM